MKAKAAGNFEVSPLGGDQTKASIAFHYDCGGGNFGSFSFDRLDRKQLRDLHRALTNFLDQRSHSMR